MTTTTAAAEKMPPVAEDGRPADAATGAVTDAAPTAETSAVVIVLGADRSPAPAEAEAPPPDESPTEETPADETPADETPTDETAEADAVEADTAEETPAPVEPAAADSEPEPAPEVEETEEAEEPPPRAGGPLFVVPAQPSADEAAPQPPPALPEIAVPGAARVRAAANPLLTAAGAVLIQARRLSEADDAPAAPEALGFELSRLLAEYENIAAAAGLPVGTVQVGRFALAATLDDLLRARPWAGACGWLRQGLAAAGPERFFDLIRVMLKNPARHRQTLELFYVCLSLGFEGRFRDRSQGGHELARIRDQLYRVLRRLTETPERALSPAPPRPAQTGADATYRPPSRAVSPTVVVFGMLFTAVSGYFAAAWLLDGRSTALAGRLQAMITEQSVATARPAPLPPPAGPELAAAVTAALAPDIRAAAVEVLAGTDGALVLRLSGGAVFPAGSDAVRAFYRAVIDRVGAALATTPGRVVVVAHTDAWALATEKFPTARALTEARAEAVRTLLEKRLGGLRLSAEGRGDEEPMDSNDTPGGRAANRRVDIRLYP